MTKEERSAYNREYRRKYLRKIHGEVYYKVRYAPEYTLSAQAFTNLPTRMSREEASVYYNRKLNKVWEKIYGKVQ